MFIGLILTQDHFARVFSSNSRDVLMDQANLPFSSCFLDQNSPATDGHFTPVLQWALPLLELFCDLASSILLGFAF